MEQNETSIACQCYKKNYKEILMTWEDPDALLKMKLGREEYLQRMLTSLVLGHSYPRWNTRNIPSVSGDSFLRELYKQVYDCELVGALEFVDELELLSGNDKDPNGAPDYAVFTQSEIWIIELKTESGSHRRDQLPLYVRLAHHAYPELKISITYLTGPMARMASLDSEDVPFQHFQWAEIAELISNRWGRSPFKAEQLLAAAILREIQGLDSPASAFRKEAAVVREAIGAAVHVQLTGEQVGIESAPGGLQELHDLRLRIRDALARNEKSKNVRPWIWSASTSGGSALTHLGSEVGYEIRLSRFQRSLE
jgi:hypothetical protein